MMEPQEGGGSLQQEWESVKDKKAPAQAAAKAAPKAGSLASEWEALKASQAPPADPFVSAPSAPPSGAGGAASAGIPRPAPTASPSMQGGGAPASASGRIPSRAEDPAAFAFNTAALMGEEFVPKDAAEAALAVSAKKYKTITGIGKKAPYVDVPQRDITSEPAAVIEQQYTPQYIEAKKAAGRWTAGDELRFKETEARQAAEALKQRRSALALKVQQQGVVAPEDEQEFAMIESDKRVAMDAYEAALKDFARSDEQVALKAMQKESNEAFMQAKRDLSANGILQPSVIEHYVIRPTVNAASNFVMNALGGSLRTLDAIGNLPSDAIGTERYYSPMAQAADWITEGVNYVSATEGDQTKKGIFDDGWNTSTDALLPQFIRTGVYMAGLVGSGAAGGTRALGLTSYLTTEEDYYREAIDAGLKPDEAQAFSIGAAASTAALEGINPQLYASGTIKGMMAKRALNAIRNGASTKEALKDATYFVAKEVGGENVQEFAQSGSDMLAKYIANQTTGEDAMDASMTPQQAAEIVVLTTALSGLMAGGARAMDRPLYQQSIEWAVQNPDEMRRFISQSVPQAEQPKVLAELDRHIKVYNGLPAEMEGPAKRKVASAVAEKERIKEEQAASLVDETVAAIIGNRFEQRIKEQDEIIAEATGTTLADVIKKQEIAKLQEQYDKAKLKSELTGKPMPEPAAAEERVVEEAPAAEEAVAETVVEEAAPATVAEEVAVAAEEQPVTPPLSEEAITPQTDAAPVVQTEGLPLREEAGGGQEVRAAQQGPAAAPAEEGQVARRNVRDVSLTLSEADVAIIKKTPSFRRMLSERQIASLKPGTNALSLNQTAYGNIKRTFGDKVTEGQVAPLPAAAQPEGPVRPEGEPKKPKKKEDERAVDERRDILRGGVYESIGRSVLEQDESKRKSAEQKAAPEAEQASPRVQAEAEGAVAWKRKGAKPVERPTAISDPDSKTRVEYSIPGFEDIPIVAVKAEGGWRSAIRVGDADMLLGDRKSAEGTPSFAAAHAWRVLEKNGREKVEAAVEQAMAAQKVKEEGPKEQRAKSPVTQDDVDALADQIAKDTGVKVLSLSMRGPADLRVDMIGVEKSKQGRGIGSMAMQQVIDFADKNGLRITLSPSPADPNWGTTSRNRLVGFYKRFGFKENKGRNKDFSVRDGMIRESRVDPKEQRPSERPAQSGKPNLNKALKALSNFGVSINIHDTKQAYADAVKDIAQGIESTWGVYDPVSNAIHVNKAATADLKQTFFHETAHPIIDALIRSNPDLAAKFSEEVVAHPNGQKYLDHMALYSDQSAARQVSEVIAEFMGDVAAGRVPVSSKPDSLWQKFKAFIQDILAALGWDTRSIDLSKPDNVREFAAQFKKAMEKGIRITGLEPVSGTTLSLQDDANRLVDGWYSRLDQAVAAKGSTMPARQWKAWLEARAKEGMLSLEESKWTGLDDFLDSKGKEKVTPQQVREFLKENRVKVEVVENYQTQYTSESRLAGDDRPQPVFKNGQQIGEIRKGPGYWEGDDPLFTYYAGVGDNAKETRIVLRSPSQILEHFRGTELASQSATKFSGWQLPGGQNYREIAITLPGPEKYRVPSAHSMGEEADVNRVLHLRLNDRTGPNGEKILFIEELQSDWGQQGKKKGFRRPRSSAGWTAVFEENRTSPGGGFWIVKMADGNFAGTIAKSGASTEAEAIRRAFDAMPDIRKGDEFFGQITAAPFVTSTDAWVELGLKQAIRMAVQGGYDKIAWTTGEQQNERYDLSKQVEEVRWLRDPNTKRRNVTIDPIGEDSIGLYVNDEGIVQETDGLPNATGKRLDEVVGKEVASKVMGEESGNLSGDGLKMEGTGMKGFYDKILPTVAKKVSKRLGGDGVVGSMDIGKAQQKGNEIGTQQSISITPAMRERVGLGVPLMQRPKTTKAKEWNAAVDDAVANNISKGPEQAIADAAELITDPDGKQAFIDAMNAAWGVTTPPLGTRANQKKVSKVLLREELNKAVEAGKRAGIADVAKARKAFVEQISPVLSEIASSVKKHRAKSIIKKAASVNPLSEKQVEAFAIDLEALVDMTKESAYEDALAEAISLSNPSRYKDRRPSGITKGRIDSESIKLMGRINELLRDGSMNDVHAAIAGIDDMLMAEDADVVAIENELEALQVAAKALSGNVDEAIEAVAAIKQIAAQGRSSLKTVLKAKAERYAKLRDDVLGDVTGGKPVKTQFERLAAQEESNTFLTRLANGINGFFDRMEGLRMLVDKMSRGKRKEGDPFGSKLDEVFYQPIATADNYAKRLNREVIDMVHKKLLDMYGSKKRVRDALNSASKPKDIGEFVDLAGKKVSMRLSPDQAMYVYNLAKNEENMATFRAMGWTDEMLAAVSESLADRQKEWADWQVDVFYPRIYRLANKVYKRMNYIDLPKRAFYIPIVRSGMGDGAGRETTVNLQDGARGVQAAMGINPGALKELQGSTKDFDLTVGATQLMLRHMSKMHHYIAYAEPIRGIAATLGDSTVREAIRQNNNSATLAVIDNFFKDIAQQGVNRDKAFGFIDRLNSRMATSSLAINPTLILKQMTAMPAYATDIPVIKWVGNLGKFAANPAKAYSELMESEYLKERFAESFDRDVAIAMAKDYKQTFAKGTKLTEYLMWNVKYGDMASILIGGYANYRYHYDEARKRGMPDKAARQLALRKFEEATKLTQQSSGITDLSHFQRGGGLARAATLYMTQPIAYFRQERKALRDMYRGGVEKDSKRFSDGVKRFFMYHVLLPSFFQWVANGLPGIVADWDDEDQEDAIRALALGSLNGIFIVGNIIEDMADKYQEKPWSQKGADIIPAFRLVYNLGDALVKTMHEFDSDDWFNEDFLEALANTTMAAVDFAGLPASRTAKMYDNYKAMADQWDNITPEQKALIIAGYNQYTAGMQESKRKGRPQRPSRPSRPGRD